MSLKVCRPSVQSNASGRALLESWYNARLELRPHTCSLPCR